MCDCSISLTTHKWLQSLDELALAFVIIDPNLLRTDYHIEVSGDALAEVQGSEADEFPTRHPLFPVTASDSTQCLAQPQSYPSRNLYDQGIPAMYPVRCLSRCGQSATDAGYVMMWRAIDRLGVHGRILANGWVRLSGRPSTA